jgi:hypothetical protein
MTAKRQFAGAVPHGVVGWQAIDWRKVHHNVCRLQARIVQATPASREGRLRGLSRMRGNSHVRFLGGGAVVTPPRYPTEPGSFLNE